MKKEYALATLISAIPAIGSAQESNQYQVSIADRIRVDTLAARMTGALPMEARIHSYADGGSRCLAISRGEISPEDKDKVGSMALRILQKIDSNKDYRIEGEESEVLKEMGNLYCRKVARKQIRQNGKKIQI